MSRVLLAEEGWLGRQVVLKLLPPAMGAAVNVERFERELQPAVRLQHTHIVPLLTTGSSGDLQPGVREVRLRLARLSTESPS
jgi:serine/threonine protein kinase